MRRSVFEVPLVGVLVVAAVGCGSSSSSTSTTSTQSAARAQLCAGVASVEAAITDLKGLSPSSLSSTQLASVNGKIVAAWSQLATAAAGAKNVNTASLQSAISTFETKAGSLATSGQSLSQAAQAIATDLAPLEQTAKGLGANCPGTSTGTTTTNG